MTDDKQYNLAAAMRFIGRSIGFTAALFLMIMIIGGAFAETEPAEAAGCILSFWRERLAIILLLLVAIGLGIYIGVYAGHNHFVTWLVLGLPYLTTTTLLFCGWWLERKES